MKKESEGKDKAEKELKKMTGKIGKVASTGREKEREVRVYVVRGVQMIILKEKERKGEEEKKKRRLKGVGKW